MTCGSIYGTISIGGEYTLTKYDKLYTKIINNPKDVNFDELDKVLNKMVLNADSHAKVPVITSTIIQACKI